MSLEASTNLRTEASTAQKGGGGRRTAAARAVLSDAMAGLRRNMLMAAAATTTIAIALTVAGGGFLASANLAHVASILESQVEVVGFLRRDLPARDQARALLHVQALPGVESARIVSRVEALRRLQRTYRALASANDLLVGNPLPDSLEVKVTDATRVRAVASALREVDGVAEVVFGAPVVDRLVALTRAVRVAGVVLAGLLVGAALLIIMNTIRLTIAARRQEIEIMTLVGATPGFVRGPFILEGALQGLLGAMAAIALITGAYIMLATQVSRSLPFLPILSPASVLPTVAGLMGLLGIGVGVGGSELGVRKHLPA